MAARKKSNAKKRAASTRARKRKRTKTTSITWLKYGLALALALLTIGSGFYWFFVRPYAYRWKPCYGQLAYGVCIPCDYSVHGIDISHYQGAIDWQELSRSGEGDFPLRFIFMKATEGGDLADPTFRQNFDSARAHGFVRGAYHFFIPTTDARRQALFFISQAPLQAGDLAPVLDVEQADRRNRQAFRRAVKTWLDVVEEHYGVKPIIYTSYKFKENYLNDSLFDAYPYWIAHYYVDSVAYRGHWEFWQHTDVGMVPGIRGAVDLNVFHGEWPDLQRYTLR